MTSPAAALGPREVGALVALVDREHFAEAEQRTRVLLRAHPMAGMLWKVLGIALLRQGKDALPALRQAADLMPDDAEAHGNLGAALHDRAQWAESLASLRRALSIDPHNVEALVDAAGASHALGRADEAVPLFESALEVRAADAHIYCGLAHALAALGRRAEAAARYGQALNLKPHFVGALNGLGNVLRDLGRRRDALPCYLRAVELDPGQAESHCNLASALFDARRLELAADHYRRALGLEPTHALAHFGLAATLRLQRRPVEAEASCRAALECDPKLLDAIVLWGEMQADWGRFADADAAFRRALAVNADFAPAYSSIAAHRRMDSADQAWLAGARQLIAKPLPMNEAINLRYALGKYFDDVGRYDEAFDHYRTANEMTKAHTQPYDRVIFSRRVDEMIRFFHVGTVGGNREPSSSELPVFIVGMPRSGTSLTEQVLASHPSVVGAGELAFWRSAYESRARRGSDGREAAETLEAMAARYLALVTPFAGGAVRLIDKMPANFLYVGLIHAAFPRARIIHVRRHPLDTCLSIYFQNFLTMGAYANDLEALAFYYGEYVRTTDHWRAVLPPSVWLDLPYESLVEDQEGSTRRLLDFLDLPWDARCLDFQRTERAVITASKWQVRQPLSSASMGRWKNYEKHLGPLQALTQSHTPP